MQAKPVVRKPSPSTSNRSRSALAANTVNLVGEWQAHRRKTGDSINAAVDALLEHVDFDHVKPHSLLEAFRVLLAGLPTGALADVSHAANAERKTLATCIGDRERGVTDEPFIAKMFPADQHVVRVLESVRCNPEAYRAAADLLATLGVTPALSDDAAGAKIRPAIPTLTAGDALAGSGVR